MLTDKEKLKLKLIKAIASGAYDLIINDDKVNAYIYQATLNAIQIVAEFEEEENPMTNPTTAEIVAALRCRAHGDACTEECICYNNRDFDCVNNFTALTVAADRLEELSRWIPVTERLPEDNPPYCQNVIVFTINGEVLPGFCNHGLWYVMREEDDYCSDADEGEVTHWRPLPEPPKEE